MGLKDINFRMFQLLEDMKILRDKEKNLTAYLPFFPAKENCSFAEFKYGYILSHDEVVYSFSKEEWSNFMGITC